MDLRRFRVAHTLRNGIEVTIRAIRRDDQGKLLEAFRNLDRSSIYTRFFGYKKELTEPELQQATHVDFESVVALVATTGSGESETLIGGGRYCANVGLGPPRTAEVAFTVEEDYQGLGIASLILKHLAGIARSKGVQRFEAVVLPGNAAMLAVFRRSGLSMHQHAEGGAVHVTLELNPQGA
jgi:RimJ/RimL family protein N-acetyltransferase